jgi:hypothetical protein
MRASSVSRERAFQDLTTRHGFPVVQRTGKEAERHCKNPISSELAVHV